MNKHPLLKIFLFAALSLSFSLSYAQDSLSNKSADNSAEGKDGKFPKTVLVELRAERNRMEALIRWHRYKDTARLAKDALGERLAMIRDFKDNFKYCPVYYFMDTDAELVKEKQFAGILFNADGSPANVSPDEYVIAYYGYLSGRYKPKENKEDSLMRITDQEVPMGRGLVIADDKFRVVTYFYKEGYDDLFFGMRKHREYKYKSKKFDIEYYPFAILFNLKLTNRQERLQFIENYTLYNLK